MIVGIGADLTEVNRIEEAIARHGSRLIERVFTRGEIQYVEGKVNRYERYAARFAAKEAGMKAIGTGWSRGVRWHDFEVANLRSGQPQLKLHGVAAEVAAGLKVRKVSLTLTHTALQALAIVILED